MAPVLITTIVNPAISFGNITPVPEETVETTLISFVKAAEVAKFVPVEVIPTAVDLRICPPTVRLLVPPEIDKLPVIVSPVLLTTGNQLGVVPSVTNAFVPNPVCDGSNAVCAAVNVEAPVPPLAIFNTPLSVNVPFDVIGEPVNVNPVVPPDAATEVTVPDELESFLHNPDPTH